MSVTHYWQSIIVRLMLCAIPLAVLCTFLVVDNANAHAILLRSDPTHDAVLALPPSKIRLWFSEDLNPTLSTVYVVKANSSATSSQTDKSTHVDQGDAHVSSSDGKEMDVTLKSNLSSAVYLVLYRTQSAEDGHILNGYFLFTVSGAGGQTPAFTGQISLNGLGTGASGQLDAPTLFSVMMVTLVDLGAVFWVGVQLWFTFVLQSEAVAMQSQQGLARRIEQRFTQYFAIPTLVVSLLANIGVLIGQAFALNGGGSDWLAAFAPQTLWNLVSQGQFGTFWIVREGVLLLALLLAILVRWRRFERPWSREALGLTNLVAGLALLIALTLSGHAAATSKDVVVYALVSDFLHLLAASLWIGGMLCIALLYLPVLKRERSLDQSHSLLTILGRFSPLAFTGVVLMAVSGPFNAITRMSAWNQLWDTAYGRTLIVKVVLVCAMLLVSAFHVFVLRPRLAKQLQDHAQEMGADTDDVLLTGLIVPESKLEIAESEAALVSSEVKVLERKIAHQSNMLQQVLRWEPLLGVAVLLCTGLLTAFSSTLLVSAAQTQTVSTTPARPLVRTVTTTDKAYTVHLTVDPNRFGLNTFTATITDTNGKQMEGSQVGISLYTTMLDMDMGTDSINLQPDGKGHFSAQGELGMGGDWQIRISVRSVDSTLHSATLKIYTPF